MTITTAHRKKTQRLRSFRDALQTGWAALRQSAPEALRRLLREERHWLWVMLPLAFLSYPSIMLASGTWKAYDYALIFQPLTPLVALALAWQFRYIVREVHQEMIFLFPIDSPKRRGGIWVVLVGCFLMLLATLITAAPVAFLALLVLAVGSIYYLYGPFVTRTLWQPLALLLMSIPLPGMLIQRVSFWLQIRAALVAGPLVQNLVPGTRLTFGTLSMPNFRMEVTNALGGINVIFVSLAVIFWYCIFKRLHAGFSLLLLIATVGVASLLNLGRIVCIAVLVNNDTSIAEDISAELPVRMQSFLLTTATIFLVIYLSRLLQTVRFRRPSAFETDLREAMSTGDNPAPVLPAAMPVQRTGDE